MKCDKNEFVYANALYNTPGLGNVTLRKLAAGGVNAGEVFLMDKDGLAELGLEQKHITNILRYRQEHDPWEEYEKMDGSGIHMTVLYSDDYPLRLKTIPDPPFVLYYKGSLPDEDTASVAVVGARMCSEYGRLMARKFGSGLADLGVQIISGMARGVDGISQKAALKAGGRSFALLGCGVDICYPEENTDLYEMLCAGGGVISEYPPGTMPRANLFPPRNRLISGLSDALLVVEARSRSGTLITVDMALEQGREVFAVPGRVCDRLSDGCIHLIKQGAIMAAEPSDITEYMAGSYRDPGTEGADHTGAQLWKQELTPMQNKVLEYLDVEPRSLSDLTDMMEKAGCGFTAQEIMSCLVELCLAGAAFNNSGRYCLTAP